jgi:hypothetical protein
MDHTQAFRVPGNALEGSGPAQGTARLCPLPQPLVELAPVDHADKAVLDRDVHPPVGGRHHACRGSVGNQQRLRNLEVLDQPWRYGAPAWLHPPAAVQEQHGSAEAREVIRGRGPGRAAAHHHHVKCLGRIHWLTFIG